MLFVDTKQYPVFVGHKPGHNTPQRHRLDIQLLMIMDRTLYIAARSVLFNGFSIYTSFINIFFG